MSGYLPGMRDPAEETTDYPNLVVCDDRKVGSITAGPTRLPLWAFVSTVVERGWGDIEESYPNAERIGARGLAMFAYHLLEHRGDFGRLLCVLADVERQEGLRDDVAWQSHQADVGPHNVCSHQLDDLGWWQHPDLADRVRKALQACLAALEDEG